jgi:tetratricopeptide (TPR) repeat protein
VYLAGYMLFSSGFAALLAAREENPTLRRIYLALAATFAVVLAFTATRGSALGFAVGLVVAGAAFLTFGRGNPYRKIGAWIVGLAALGVVAFAVGREIDAVRQHPVFGRYVNASLEDKTFLSRIVNAQTAWKGFLERPLLGWGQGNYSVVFDSRYDIRLHDQEQYFDHTHSILTDWLVAAGALGALAYFALFALVARGLWRADGFRGDQRVILVALLVAYLVHNVFVFDNVASYAHYAALVGLAAALGPVAREPRRRHVGADAAALGCAALAIALPFTAYAVNGAPMAAARGVIGAMTAADIDAARADFEGAIARGTFGTPEIAYQYAQYAVRVASAPEEQVPAAIADEFVTAADAALAAAASSTAESYYQFGLGGFRLRVGNAAGAIAPLEEAVRRAPQKQSVRATLAMAYAWAGDARALDYARETYEIEKANEHAWRAYARVAAKLGRADIFEALVAEAREAGNYEWVVTLTYETVATSPANPQARASFVRALLDAGRYDDASAELDRAAKDFPKIAPQFEAFRAEIDAARAAGAAGA